MLRSNKFFITLLILLLVALGLVLCALCNRTTECHRLRQNQEALMDSMTTYVTTTGRHAAEVKRLTLTTHELKEQNRELTNRIKSLGVRRRDIQGVQTVGTLYTAHFRPDTVFIYDTLRDTVLSPAPYRVLQYSDEWLQFRFDSMMHVSLRDTVIIVQHAKVRRFLFWKWKRYTGRATAVASSPYAHITTLQSIEIEK